MNFVRVKHPPFVLSLHRADKGDVKNIDADWYCDQLLRAADEVLRPFGVPRHILEAWFDDDGAYWTPEDYVKKTPQVLPLDEEVLNVVHSL